MNILQGIYDKFSAGKDSMMALYGVGNHGGGPTKALIEKIGSLGYDGSEFSTTTAFFDSADYSVAPVVKDELQHHARGCYSANAQAKKANRECEERLLATERIAVLANKLVGYAYPSEELKRAWENLLFNQFHDILAGCSIPSAYRDAKRLWDETLSICDKIANGAMQAIGRKIDTGAPTNQASKDKSFAFWEKGEVGAPIVVFNSLPYPVKQRVELKLRAEKVLDESGKQVKTQTVYGEYNDGSQFTVSTFIATVPALGYKIYRAFNAVNADAPLNLDGETTLRNDKVEVIFDERTGEIAKIKNLLTGKEITGEFASIFTDESDCDTWAHDKFDLGDECGRFGEPRFERIAQGEVVNAVRVTTTCANSTLIRDYYLDSGSEVLKVKGEIRTYEKRKALKICFPASEKIKCGQPFAKLVRPLLTGEEHFQRWFESGGLAVATSGSYSYDSTESSVRMTVLRTCAFADHYGKRLPFEKYQGQGSTFFEYSIFPFTSESNAEKVADEFYSPLYIQYESFHGGCLSSEGSGVNFNDDSVVITAIKKAEDNGFAVLRVFETAGEKKEYEINLFGKKIAIPLQPFSVVTVREDGKIIDIIERE